MWLSLDKPDPYLILPILAAVFTFASTYLSSMRHFQTKSMRKTQELQPQLKALQQKYSSKDPETQRLFREEQQRLYAENNVNFSGCLYVC